MARTYEFIVGSGEAGIRLDHYLARRLPAAVSRAMIQRSIRAGQVTLAGRPMKVHHKLQAADRIRAVMEQLPARGGQAALTPQPIPLEIVHEDASVLVVNKPAGLVTHPAPGHWDGTLVNAVLWHLGKGHELARAGIVHRLDKDTSGLLLVAKTEAAHFALAKQLKARTLKRRYLAVVEGLVPLDTGTVHVPIGRHQTHRKVMTVRHLGGRVATTHYRVVKRVSAGIAHTLLDVSLETGRTHQIRVHMAHLGYPVVGDTAYGRHPASYWTSLGVTRQLLHAYRLRFRHPATGKDVSVEAPLPDDMVRWVDAESRTRLAAA